MIAVAAVAATSAGAIVAFRFSQRRHCVQQVMDNGIGTATMAGALRMSQPVADHCRSQCLYVFRNDIVATGQKAQARAAASNARLPRGDRP